MLKHKRFFILAAITGFIILDTIVAYPAQQVLPDTNQETQATNPFVQTWINEAKGIHRAGLIVFPSEGGLISCRGNSVSFYTNLHHLTSVPAILWYGIWTTIFSYKASQCIKGLTALTTAQAIVLCACALGFGLGALSEYRALNSSIKTIAFTPDGFFLFNRKIAPWKDIASFAQDRKDVVNQSG